MELTHTRIHQAFVAPLAKSVLDETNENFHGVYMGIATPNPETKTYFESADLTIHVGRFPSDTNTGGFTAKLAPKVIGLHPHYVFVGDTRWESVSFVPIMQKLVGRLASRERNHDQTMWCKSVSTLHEK